MSISLLIKPVSNSCNISCDYCFYHDVTKYRSNNEKKMTIETLENVVKRAFEHTGDTISFAFQGGEPTLIGMEYYEAFTKLIKKYNINKCTVNISLQTNGMLIDEQWASFFRKHDFLIGISLDGILELHDLHRKSFNNEPTHHLVMNSIRILTHYKVDFNVLQVVTKHSLLEANRTYDFFIRNGLTYIQMIPVLDDLYEGFENNSYSLTHTSYGDYLIKVFDLWYDDFIQGKGLRILFFENLISKIMGKKNIACGLNGKCTIQLVVEPDGAVYPCDFYATDEWRLGNLNQDSIQDIFQSNRSSLFILESYQLTDTCNKCKWFHICEGGCKRYRQFNKNKLTSNKLCSSYKKFYSHAYPKMLGVAMDLLR